MEGFIHFAVSALARNALELEVFVDVVVIMDGHEVADFEANLFTAACAEDGASAWAGVVYFLCI